MRLDLPSCDVIGFLAIWAWGGESMEDRRRGLNRERINEIRGRGRRCAE